MEAALLYADRKTDGHYKLIGTYHDYANAPKKVSVINDEHGRARLAGALSQDLIFRLNSASMPRHFEEN